jgi:hypothetical protein
MRIKPHFVLDSNEKKIAVQLDLETFRKMEEALENFGLYRLMDEKKASAPLAAEEAQTFYKSLKKKK